MSLEYDAVGFGALNCDHIMLADLDSVPLGAQQAYDENTQMFLAYGSEAAAGGSAANTIYGLAKLGLRTAFVGAVGADSDGEILLNSFREVGVAEDAIARYLDAPTGAVLCLSGDHGRLLVVNEGANSRYSNANLRDALQTVLRKTKLVHLTSFVGDAQLALQNQLMNELPDSTLVSCAPGKLYVDRGQSAIKPLLARTDHGLFNSSEIRDLMGYNDPETAATAYLRTFSHCQAVVVTHGSGLTSGNKVITSQVFTPDNRRFDIDAPPEATAVVDTTGAGDAFAAGYLRGVLMGAEPQQAALMGDVVARLSLGGVGARSALPDRAQFEATLAQ